MLEVFNSIDTDNSGSICEDELRELLNSLGMVASHDEVAALFKTLDVDGSGSICFDEFTGWYENTLETCLMDGPSATSAVIDNLKTRRTVNDFSTTPVNKELVNEALEAAIMAPNHRRTEPWRFISLGPKAIKSVAALVPPKKERWSRIPGWMVVTAPKSSDPLVEKEDYAAVCCAVQNFQLALWANDVGTKWTTGDVTRTEEFNSICGIDGEDESVVGCLWYGWAEGEVKEVKRRKSVSDILTELD
ncbi:hypothetical protein TrRE_jg9554 [Triparma retinervis]|uniref:EF-hand domain-containing protein n=1 Tax=Triparma retinervis TaxID=2557542 RepID=A0A9W7E4T7_9STRA|nr:hypothetical protein TrRE_jg9554 [Triparma retinervis]